MKKTLFVAALLLATGAQAQDIKNFTVRDMMCRDQAKIAMMLAQSKKDGKPSGVSPDAFRDTPALYELVSNMDRIATANQSLDLVEVARLGWSWCMDNIERITFDNRR